MKPRASLYRSVTTWRLGEGRKEAASLHIRRRRPKNDGGLRKFGYQIQHRRRSVVEDGGKGIGGKRGERERRRVDKISLPAKNDNVQGQDVPRRRDFRGV